MFLFILESIGTQELILIAGLALIVFGPRKLPEIVKTISKTMAQFRNATSEFKATWEKEVEFDEIEKVNENLISPAENVISDKSKTINPPTTQVAKTPSPEIKELSFEEIERIFKNKKNQETSSQPEEIAVETQTFAKKDWL